MLLIPAEDDSYCSLPLSTISVHFRPTDKTFLLAIEDSSYCALASIAFKTKLSPLINFVPDYKLNQHLSRDLACYRSYYENLQKAEDVYNAYVKEWIRLGKKHKYHMRLFHDSAYELDDAAFMDCIDQWKAAKASSRAINQMIQTKRATATYPGDQPTRDNNTSSPSVFDELTFVMRTVNTLRERSIGPFLDFSLFKMPRAFMFTGPADERTKVFSDKQTVVIIHEVHRSKSFNDIDFIRDEHTRATIAFARAQAECRSEFWQGRLQYELQQL